MEYYTILTDAGRALEAAALAGKRTYTLAACALGDGSGMPDPTRTTLQNEVWRGPINTLAPDSDNPTWLVIEAHVPPEDGGFTIREFGIYTDDGTLFAIGNYPETYKPKLENGTGIDLIVRPICQVSNTESVTLLVDPAILMASRKYVDDSIASSEAGLREEIKSSAVAASTVLPVVNGTVNRGTDKGFARGDHVHPVDTSRAASVHTHTTAQISDLQAALNAKEDKVFWPGNGLTLYVRTDGNDANDGLSYTPGGAFKTLAGAVRGIRDRYCRSGWSVMILVGPGTYEQLSVNHIPIALDFRSYDMSNKAVITTALNDHCIRVDNNSFVYLTGFILSPSSNETGGTVLANNSATVYCTDLTCRQMGKYGFRSMAKSVLYVRGETEIKGGGGYAFSTEISGCVVIEGNLRLTEKPEFDTFCSASANSHIRAVLAAITGEAKGRRYHISINSSATTGNRPSLFPGTSEGVLSHGGQYL